MTSPGGELSVPDWLDPIRTALDTISGRDLTAFLPPEEHDARASAVLMLFGEDERGPDLLLTERSHTMRSHPGQVSFPGGRLDPGEGPHEAALREAYEETGLDPAGVHLIGDLPELWIPPSNNVVTPVVGWWHEPSPVRVKSLEEVHAIYRVPIAELRDPAHRVRVRSPRVPGMIGPGFLIGPDKDVILWGFTGGIIARLFEFVGWLEAVPDAPMVDLPDYMLQGRTRDERP